jgi:transposase
MNACRKSYDSNYKQAVLEYYQNNKSTESFASVAKKFNIQSGKKTVFRWYQRWNGTAQSLKQRARSGRPRVLNKSQVYHTIATPINESHKHARPIHYTDLIQSVQQKTHTHCSLRTIQRIGQQNDFKQKRTHKRSFYESNLYTHTHT